MTSSTQISEVDAALLTESERAHVDNDLTDKYHVLVVDDSKLQRKILLNWLQDSFLVSEAESGEQAYEMLLTQKINLALVDVEMPGMNGFELLERIKSNPQLDHLPVILMSAADRTAESAAKSVQGGGQDYLFKPLIKALLIKKVETLLEIVKGNKRAAAYRAIVARKEQEIIALRSKVSELDTFRQEALEALDTPIQAITRSISSLMRDATIQASPIRAELEKILQAMSNTDLYKPAFSKIAAQDNLDPVVGSYLLSEFASSDTQRNTPMPTFPELIHEDSIEGLNTWEFNLWELEEQDLLPLLKEMFESFGLVQRFKIPVPKLERFIMKVRDSYRDNPYHNFRHAFDVTQTVYAVLTTMNAAKYLGHLDVLALLISAMCHDIGHPGTNNAFQVNTMSELAITYNDKAVLENFHCSTTFQLFLQPELSILEGLSQEEFHEIRKLIISCVLATDPASHFESTTKLMQRLESGREFDRSCQEDRIMIMETILHLSDISNISKPWEVAKIWTDRVGDEFFRQGDMEKEKGMPVAPFMDRTKSSKARTSANFIDFVAVPLFQVVAQLLPESRTCLEYIADNRKRLEELIKSQV